MRGPARTAIAAALSVAMHGGAVAALLVTRGETVNIAGGATAIALVGDTSVDAVAAGTSTPVIEPVETGESAQEVPPSAVQLTQSTAAPPVQTVMAQPENPVQARAAIEVAATSPVQAVEAASAAEIQAADAVAPVESKPTEAAEAAASEVATLNVVPLPSARPVEPTKPVEPVQTAAVDPRPELPRHEPLKPQVQPAPKEQQPDQARKKATPQQAGNGGRSRAEARKGTAAGRSEGEQAEAGETRGKASREGNASTSNYPGKVVSKLRRALRYPAEAKRQKVRGEVHVAFTVASGGSVSAVRVVRSSGSPVLDRAAVETVQRAAPFPPIPDGRASWPFTVPLAFSR